MDDIICRVQPCFVKTVYLLHEVSKLIEAKQRLRRIPSFPSSPVHRLDIVHGDPRQSGSTVESSGKCRDFNEQPLLSSDLDRVSKLHRSAISKQELSRSEAWRAAAYTPGQSAQTNKVPINITWPPTQKTSTSIKIVRCVCVFTGRFHLFPSVDIFRKKRIYLYEQRTLEGMFR